MILKFFVNSARQFLIPSSGTYYTLDVSDQTEVRRMLQDVVINIVIAGQGTPPTRDHDLTTRGKNGCQTKPQRSNNRGFRSGW